MKVEYSDLYKFVTSIGIALISLSVLVPWLFFREPFDLLLKQDEVKLLTPLAQSIIQNRQVLLQTAFVVLPWFSLVSFTLGLLAVLIGGVMWLRKTQKLTDKMNELNIRLLENKLAAETPEQANEKRAEEFKSQIESEAEPVTEVRKESSEGRTARTLEPDVVSDFVQSAYNVERKLADSLAQCFIETHETLTNRRLGAASFDIVLAAKTDFFCRLPL